MIDVCLYSLSVILFHLCPTDSKFSLCFSPTIRNAKEPIVIARKFRWFNKDIYKDRYKVERTFGWQDTYRKLALSYDKLKETRLGFRNLAYSMINYRVTFNNS